MPNVRRSAPKTAWLRHARKRRPPSLPCIRHSVADGCHPDLKADSMATVTPLPPTAKSTAERMFPQLTPAQIARVAAHGRTRTMQQGEVLFDVGDPAVQFLLVLSGQIESVRQLPEGDELVAVHNPGQFSGEVSLLAGRRALVRARVSIPGEVIELTREQLLALVQTDSEIGELLMRAFIL